MEFEDWQTVHTYTRLMTMTSQVERRGTKDLVLYKTTVKFHHLLETSLLYFI